MTHVKVSSSIFIISSIILFFLIGCSDSIGSEVNTQNSIIPLKLGNSWEYQYTDYDSTETVTGIRNVVQKVLKDTIISNTKWYMLNSSVKDSWFTNKLDGYWVFTKANNNSNFIVENDTAWIVYKYPTFKGDLNGDYEVVSLDEEVTVPAGTFRCIHIVKKYENSQNYSLGSFEMFITPGIGSIKWMQVNNKSGDKKYVVYKFELVNYELQ